VNAGTPRSAAAGAPSMPRHGSRRPQRVPEAPGSRFEALLPGSAYPASLYCLPRAATCSGLYPLAVNWASSFWAVVPFPLVFFKSPMSFRSAWLAAASLNLLCPSARCVQAV